MNLAYVSNFSPHVLPVPIPTPVVFVVDPDPSVRQSLELLLRFEGWQPETFSSVREFLARPRTATPSCLVLDPSLPGIDGLELQERIADERPNTPIIFITAFVDIQMAVQAMKAGAVEFLTKPFQNHVLVNAIRHALDRSRRALHFEKDSQELRHTYASLSPREREVMTLVVSGMLNKQIGSALGISEVTVKAHRGRVMHKMNVGSLADLVRTASRLESLTPNWPAAGSLDSHPAPLEISSLVC